MDLVQEMEYMGIYDSIIPICTECKTAMPNIDYSTGECEVCGCTKIDRVKIKKHIIFDQKKQCNIRRIEIKNCFGCPFTDTIRNACSIIHVRFDQHNYYVPSLCPLEKYRVVQETPECKYQTGVIYVDSCENCPSVVHDWYNRGIRASRCPRKNPAVMESLGFGEEFDFNDIDYEGVCPYNSEIFDINHGLILYQDLLKRRY